MGTYFLLVESCETVAYTSRELAERAMGEEMESYVKEVVAEIDEHGNVYDVENDRYIRVIE